jgi:hypothetical protein
LTTKKITVQLLFGAGQIVVAFAYIFLALLLKLNLLNIQALSNIQAETVDFYTVIFLTVGFVLILGGLFLVFDWRESR